LPTTDFDRLRVVREKLPYRTSAGIALLDQKGQVWLGRRRAKWMDVGSAPFWQLPQGGIEKGEAPVDAALRELGEETGVRAVEIIGEIDRWLTYDLPDELLGVALKGRYRGQRQRWFAMRFLGSDEDFDIGAKTRKGKAEFDAWRWGTLEEAVALSVPWKRDVYATVAVEFANLRSSFSEAVSDVANGMRRL